MSKQPLRLNSPFVDAAEATLTLKSALSKRRHRPIFSCFTYTSSGSICLFSPEALRRRESYQIINIVRQSIDWRQTITRVPECQPPRAKGSQKGRPLHRKERKRTKNISIDISREVRAELLWLFWILGSVPVPQRKKKLGCADGGVFNVVSQLL